MQEQWSTRPRLIAPAWPPVESQGWWLAGGRWWLAVLHGGAWNVGASWDEGAPNRTSSSRQPQMMCKQEVVSAQWARDVLRFLTSSQQAETCYLQSLWAPSFYIPNCFNHSPNKLFCFCFCFWLLAIESSACLPTLWNCQHRLPHIRWTLGP